MGDDLITDLNKIKYKKRVHLPDVTYEYDKPARCYFMY